MSIFSWMTRKEEGESYYCITCNAQIATGLPNSPTWKEMVKLFAKEHLKHGKVKKEK